jgi:hypothetical protein
MIGCVFVRTRNFIELLDISRREGFLGAGLVRLFIISGGWTRNVKSKDSECRFRQRV